jgi:hypothetical protein
LDNHGDEETLGADDGLGGGEPRLERVEGKQPEIDALLDGVDTNL